MARLISAGELVSAGYRVLQRDCHLRVAPSVARLPRGYGPSPTRFQRECSCAAAGQRRCRCVGEDAVVSRPTCRDR
jgi:hypothetical protein